MPIWLNLYSEGWRVVILKVYLTSKGGVLRCNKFVLSYYFCPIMCNILARYYFPQWCLVWNITGDSLQIFSSNWFWLSNTFFQIFPAMLCFVYPTLHLQNFLYFHKTLISSRNCIFLAKITGFIMIRVFSPTVAEF